MAAAPLTSNHVNYLIWRYLQESGHDKSAARLQRDWKIGDPETLPFAQHIRTHALVSLVQKGLQYHELESSLQQNGDRATQTPTALFFGTDSADAAPSREPNDASSSSSAARAPSSPRKHARESIAGAEGLAQSAQAPAAKRQRRVRDGAASASVSKSGDEMDLDQQHDAPSDAEQANEASAESDAALLNGKLEHQDTAPGVSPSEAPAAPTPSPPPVATLESGQSVPTQTDSILQVGREHTQLLETDASKEALLIAWNPLQPNLLISGGDGLCRLFQWPGPVPFGGAPATNGSALGGAAPQTHDLFESMTDASITALAWSPDGQQVAVARHIVDSETASLISLFDSAGALEGELSQSQQYFLGLVYSPSGSYLLGYGGVNEHHADESRDYCLCVWDTSNPQPTEPLTMLTAPRQEISGAAWLDDGSVVVCGPALIAQTKLVDGRLQAWQPILPDLARGPVHEPREWSMVAADKQSDTCILAAADQGILALLSEDKQNLSIHDAHAKAITGLQYQPLPPHGSAAEGPRLVASASEDGSVKIWNAANGLSLVKSLQCDSLRPDLCPVLAMQFSPDGATLAAASYNKVMFWRPDRDGAWPSAEWVLSAGIGWRSVGSPGNEAMTNGDEGKPNGVANGVNGHSKSNGVNGTRVNEGVQADRMHIDGEEEHTASSRADEEESFATTLLWSAMGKKIAFGSKNQIAVADFTKAQSQ